MSAYSRSIKEQILDVDYDIDDIDELLKEDEDYNEVMQGLFGALFMLLRFSSKNQIKINEILEKLEELCENETSGDRLEYVSKNVIIMMNDINKYFAINQKKNVHYFISRLMKLNKFIRQKEVDKLNQNKIKMFEYLIYQERDIEKIKYMIKDNPDILAITNEDGHNILFELLDNYVKLDEKNIEDIDYFYKVIILFINNKNHKNIIKDRLYYLTILNNPMYVSKKHILSVINIFQEKCQVSIEELESKYRVHLIYPKNIETDVNEFKMNNDGRYDFTKQNVITIDGENDKCLDDALFIKKNKDGTYNLYVHIIDIPGFVPYKSRVHKEAMLREEALYLFDNNKVYVYPEVISDYICSIVPNNNRNVITYSILLDPRFDVIDFKILKGKIRSKHKMSYEEVDKRLENPCDDDLDMMLSYLANFSMRQKSLNRSRDQYRKIENLINPKDYHQSMRTDYSISANIVQESMILPNCLIPKYFYNRGFPYPNRVLHKENDGYLDEQFDLLLLNSGILLDDNERVKLLKKLKYIFLMAKYSATEHGHSGIGVDFYSHSTSPARRSADALGQYVIYDLLFHHNVSDKNIYFWEEELHRWCEYFNERKIINEAFSEQFNYLASKKLIRMK